MTADTRRFQFCLLASLVINGLALALVGWFWRPQAAPVTHVRPHLKWVALALPHATKPPPVPTAPKPPRPKTLRHPGRRVHSARSAPPIRPVGGSRARRAAPAPIPAPALAASSFPAMLPVITGKRPVRLIAHNAKETHFTLLALAANSETATRPSGLPAAGASDGAGPEGQGSGARSGNGTAINNATGNGVSRDVGEPFGVGSGLPGDGAPRHVVYVLDISGSMTSRIKRAEEELRRALDGLQPGETFNIVAFSDGVQSFDGGMATATPDTVRRAEEFLHALSVNGGTNLEGAMAQALTLPDVNKVVVLTDGVPTIGETDFKKLARRVRALNKNHARISTVGLVGRNPDGTDDTFEATKLLRQIADESGGTAKLVPLGIAGP